jgi:hypothetical protein
MQVVDPSMGRVWVSGRRESRQNRLSRENKIRMKFSREQLLRCSSTMRVLPLTQVEPDAI